MGKAKPFLFGSLLGASLMFVSLQYHVVRSHDGFQLVPRTPQHSLGLAYADIRQWNAAQWADRTELARALMAHGSGDLISQSVADSLADTVSSESATLEQLKAFLNKAGDDEGNLDQGLFRLPDLMPGAAPDSSNGDSGETISIPFPRSASGSSIPDPFRMARTSERNGEADAVPGPSDNTSPAAAAAAPSRFSVSDILDEADSPSETQRFSEAVGKAIFGSSEAPAPVPTARAAATTPAVQSQPKPQTSASTPFGDISTDLESRARAALSRAQSSLSEQAQQVVRQEAPAAESYFREQLQGVTGRALGSNPTPAAVPDKNDPLRALQEKFDPFID